MAGKGEDQQANIVALDTMLDAVRGEIGSMVAELGGWLQALSAGKIEHRDDARQDVEAWIGRIDRLGLDLRRAESAIARCIVRLDTDTGHLMAMLDRPSAARRSNSFTRLFGRHDPQAERLMRERQVAEGLCRQLIPTDGLMAIMDTQQAFLKQQLPFCEMPLDEALACLKRLCDPKRRSGDDIALETRIGSLALSIDLLQDLTDALLDALVCVNLMREKLRIDAQQRVMAISALAGDTITTDILAASYGPLPCLEPLFAQARRRLLSVGGVAAAKLRLDEAFRRRIAGSRQARAG